MTDETIDTARGIFRVLETGDANLAQRVASPQFTNREAAVAPPAASSAGPAGLLASSAWMRFAFSDLHFEIAEVAAAGSHVWLRLRMQGVHTGAFVQFQDGRAARVLPPTRRTIDFEQIHLVEMDGGGSALRHEAVRDDITMLGQLGVFPPGPQFLWSVLAFKISGRERRAVAEVLTATDRAATGTTRTPSNAAA